MPPQSDDVVGIGLDLIEVSRMRDALARHGERFARRLLHTSEFVRWSDSGSGSRGLARAFAVKEAYLKALGTGWAEGLSFAQVEFLEAAGEARPGVRLHGAAAIRAGELGVARSEVALSGGRTIVAACVVLLRTEYGPGA